MTAPNTGITFRETMGGWFALGVDDPRKGHVEGQRHHTRLTVRPIVTIESLDRLQFDSRHTGKLESSIEFAPLFGPVRPVGEHGIFNLFARVGNTKLKLMIYEFGFTHEKESYYFAGFKTVENDPGLDMWKDTTTLFSKLYKGSDKTGQVLGSGILRISLPGFVRQLTTMKAINSSSPAEKVDALLTFGHFFASELWDSYGKRS